MAKKTQQTAPGMVSVKDHATGRILTMSARGLKTLSAEKLERDGKTLLRYTEVKGKQAEEKAEDAGE